MGSSCSAGFPFPELSISPLSLPSSFYLPRPASTLLPSLSLSLSLSPSLIPSLSLPRSTSPPLPGVSACVAWAQSSGGAQVCWTWCTSPPSSCSPAATTPTSAPGTSASAPGTPLAVCLTLDRAVCLAGCLSGYLLGGPSACLSLGLSVCLTLGWPPCLSVLSGCLRSSYVLQSRPPPAHTYTRFLSVSQTHTHTHTFSHTHLQRHPVRFCEECWWGWAVAPY